MGKLKKIVGNTSEIKDRSSAIETICSLQLLDTVKIKKDLSIKTGLISINNIIELCKMRKLRITIDFNTSYFEVIVEELEAKGEKVINAPEHIKNTEVDFVEVASIEERLEDVESEDNEEEPF